MGLIDIKSSAVKSQQIDVGDSSVSGRSSLSPRSRDGYEAEYIPLEKHRDCGVGRPLFGFFTAVIAGTTHELSATFHLSPASLGVTVPARSVEPLPER